MIVKELSMNTISSQVMTNILAICFLQATIFIGEEVVYYQSCSTIVEYLHCVHKVLISNPVQGEKKKKVLTKKQLKLRDGSAV